ncbi:hypothetical protein C882_1789 [Caenispirillum salinarum AK4]|uniref:DUF1190 domain-containing protein n=1 Tax=Caenispirillum salinarum AK4 TaxID=1238182 RepID=K9GQ62_9PROT|nr:DUF1190 domain-containing protein [Caenispirillum salinarum]EKV27287.1 hypothetical protein C882_1789 [Caenispirillum salinarum AK4]
MPKQKRSQRLTLRRMAGSGTVLRAGLAGSVVVTLSACGDEPTAEVQAFRSVPQCVESGLFDEEACRTMLQEAMAEHEENAPRYEERALCEEEFGLNACEYQQQGGGYWMPFFTGWVVGSLAAEAIDEVGDRYRKKRGLRVGGGRYYTQPFYRTTADASPFRTLSGGTLMVDRDGTVRTQARALASTPKSAPKVLTRTTISRSGGFAGTSRFGGGGFRFGG